MKVYLLLLAFVVAIIAQEADNEINFVFRGLMEGMDQGSGSAQQVVCPSCVCKECDHDNTPSRFRVVRNRGYLRCGISTGDSFFAAYNETEDCFEGMDVDLCKAVGVAIFGPGKVNIEFVRVGGADRFAALENDEIDVLFAAATDTLTRRTNYELLFTGVYFYDGQAFMAPVSKDWDDVDDMLTGTNRLTRPIVVDGGTTSEQNVRDLLVSYQRDPAEFLVVLPSGSTDAFISSIAYNAVTSDSSVLVSARAKSADPGLYEIFTDRISREPLAGAVRNDDSEWFDIVNSVVNGLIAAELLGVSSENVLDISPGSGEACRLVGKELTYVHELPVSRFFMRDIISVIGNYGEIYERHWEEHLPREGTHNALYTNGGLHQPFAFN